MLEEYKKIYEENANLISDWKNLSCLELANNYLNESNSLRKESYLSAIICNRWHLIGREYSRQCYKFADPEDIYEWLVTAIMYVLEHHVWTNPESNLYEDPEAVEKAKNKNE